MIVKLMEKMDLKQFFNLVKDFFNQVDKLKHIFVCIVLMTILKPIVGTFFAIVITAVISIAIKEFLIDKKLGKGQFDVKDIYADIIGIIVGIF